jgi:uncharacterized protein YndB with AHSA1/START domain
MDTLTATGGMLIRRPLDVVREAFVDPAVTTRFWFTESTGRLEPGAVVRWTWAMYGVATQVRVHANEANRILVEWDTDNNPTEVEWLFSPRGADTFVEVENRGFAAGDTVKAMDSAGGFALVLGAAKIWLEHGIDPRFIVDRHPDHHVAGWSEGS